MAAADALQDPFQPTSQGKNDPARASSTLLAPLVKTHRPTLTALLSTADLDASARPDGPDHPELPLAPPLSHAALTAPDWDASAFLLERRHTPLDDLRGDLRAYLATLRTSLVGVINHEYEAFIGLSLGLKRADVAHSLATVRRPVLALRGEVTRVHAELHAMRDEMSAVLDQRKQVRQAKAQMRRLLATDDAVDKVMGLLHLRDRPDPASRPLDLSVDSPARRLERIASEYIHMRYLVDRAGDLPFVHSLKPRIDRTTTALHRDLSDLLSSILAGSPASPTYRSELTTALRTLASLGLVPQAEDCIRRELVRPFVQRVLHRDALAASAALRTSAGAPDADSDSAPTTPHPHAAHVPPAYRLEPLPLRPEVAPGGANGGATLPPVDPIPLAVLYNRVLEFVETECGVLLDVAERVLADVPASIPAAGGSAGAGAGARQDKGSSTTAAVAEEEKEEAGARNEPEEQDQVQGYEVLANVILDEVAQGLMGELGGVVFAAGRPGVFHQNYLLTTNLIARLESLCPTLARLRSVRSHPSTIALSKRFQLPVYFQLRLKDAVGAIERAFEVGSASGGGMDGWVMSESEAVWKALVRCWDDEVYLPELAGRFWRLTLQILSRYRTWLHDHVPRYVLPSSPSTTSLAALDPDRSRLGSSSSANNSRPGTPSAGTDEVSEETTLRQLTVLVADAMTMERRVLDLFETRLRDKLPGGEDEDAEAAEVLRESLAALTSLVPSLSSQITTLLLKRSVEPLKLVRSVASQVRASTRKGPPEPSYFVPSLLREVRAYLSGPGRVVDEETRRKWATVVVDEIATRYAAILSTQKKTEDSLRWLKKGRQGLSFFGRAASSAVGGSGGGGGGGGGGGADDGPTDDERVKAQMQLDVEALAAEAVQLGVDVDHSEAFQALRRATAAEGNKEETK